MSNTKTASGITVPDNIVNSIKKGKGGSLGWIKVQIENEKFVEKHIQKGGSSFSSDFDSISKYLDNDDPSFFIAFNKKQIILVLYVPDTTSIKAKMQYSSSKNALVAECGQGVQHYFGTTKSELTYRAYNASINSEKPLSADEELSLQVEKELKRGDMTKYGGYSLIARMNNKALPVQLKHYSNSQSVNFESGSSSSSTSSSSKVQQVTKSFGLPSQSCAVDGCPNKRSVQSYCVRHAKSSSSSTSPKAKSNSLPTSLSAQQLQAINQEEQVSKDSDSLPVPSSSGLPRKSSVHKQTCAVAGCSQQRVAKGYCSQHQHNK